jgi:hypothetical protein
MENHVLSGLEEKKKKTGRCWTLLGRASYSWWVNCSSSKVQLLPPIEAFFSWTRRRHASIDRSSGNTSCTHTHATCVRTVRRARPHTDDWSIVLRLRKRLSLPSSMHASHVPHACVHIEFAFISVKTTAANTRVYIVYRAVDEILLYTLLATYWYKPVQLALTSWIELFIIYVYVRHISIHI